MAGLFNSAVHGVASGVGGLVGGVGGVVGGVVGGLITQKVKGTVVLMKRNVLDFTDVAASVIDTVGDLVGNKISFQLVSSSVVDANSAGGGKVGSPAYLETWITALPSLTAGESAFTVEFDWKESDGVPGAIVVKNNHQSEFFLKSVAIDDLPGHGRLVFACDSWVYPVADYSYDRVFFTNKVYLPSDTPAALRPLRDAELIHLRGDGTGQRQDYDRIYDYALYNDLGDPDKGSSFARPVLGGSADLPYPRRGRTGRPPTQSDPNTESRLSLLGLSLFYIPRDERFGHIKMSDFLGYTLRGIAQTLIPTLRATLLQNPDFKTFQDVFDLYSKGLPLPDVPELDKIRDQLVPLEMLKDLLPDGNARLLKLPIPQCIAVDKFAWRTDEEFGREALAGVNPVIIRLLTEFPPTSKLDPTKYGDQSSRITAAHIEPNMDGLTASEALTSQRLFILNHHDDLVPFLRRINTTTDSRVYATRTLLFLSGDGTLRPVAIELSLPHPDGDQYGSVGTVYTPAAGTSAADGGVAWSVWQLAKAFAAVADTGVHQLISHWLNTHAVIEPFVIATCRQLSDMHPVHRLLKPHYRDTMNINALARQVLINAGGIIEQIIFPGSCAMEFSSVVYKDWKLTEQGLPADLLKRGVAVEDATKPGGVRLLIEDYPYAVDGLAIWTAIETWVRDYCSIYYSGDGAVAADAELQAWWTEIWQVGHGDKRDEDWWPAMQSAGDLVGVCTTVIWVASALHAAVNFGQYPYGGFNPNRPTMSRRFMPEPGTDDYAELERDPDGVFLKTITSQLQTLIGISVLEVLSTHSSDEVYLGQRDSPEWTADGAALQAFGRFGETLAGIEKRIVAMNADAGFRNRNGGPVKVPYTLLYPDVSDVSGTGGLTGRGVPNSISI